MNVAQHVYQGHTESCTLMAVANALSLLIRMIFCISVSAASIFTSLIHTGFTLTDMDPILLQYVALSFTVILRTGIAVIFYCRTKIIGPPTPTTCQRLEMLLNKGEIFIYGFYRNKRLIEIGGNMDDNENNHNRNKKEELIYEDDKDHGHSVCIERIKTSSDDTGDKYVAFVKETDGNDIGFCYMDMSIFDCLYVVEVVHVAINRSDNSYIYNAINYIEDDRDVIISPSFFTHSRGPLVQDFLTVLVYNIPNFDEANKLDMFSKNDNADNERMDIWTEYVSGCNLLKRNAFIKISSSVSRIFLLIEGAISWINYNLMDLTSFNELTEDIFWNKDASNDNDKFVLFIRQRYAKYGKYHQNASELKDIRSIYTNYRAFRCDVVRKIFIEHIWHIFDYLDITRKNNDRWGLNREIMENGTNWVQNIKEMKCIMPGWELHIDELVKKLEKIKNIKFKPKTTATIDDKIFYFEIEEFRNCKKKVYIPRSLKLGLAKTMTSSKSLSEYLSNREILDGNKLFNAKDVMDELDKLNNIRRRCRIRRKRKMDFVDYGHMIGKQRKIVKTKNYTKKYHTETKMTKYGKMTTCHIISYQ